MQAAKNNHIKSKENQSKKTQTEEIYVNTEETKIKVQNKLAV